MNVNNNLKFVLNIALLIQFLFDSSLKSFKKMIGRSRPLINKYGSFISPDSRNNRQEL